MNKRLCSFMLTMCTVPHGYAMSEPEIFEDPDSDAVIRRTDEDGDAPLNPDSSLPDLVRIEIGGWNAIAPDVDPYTGQWIEGEAAHLLRLNIVFDGLINPPGPNGLQGPEYDPFEYGTNPVYGFVEFDIDESVDTGGEIDQVRNRFLGNVSRFGGLLEEEELSARMAIWASDIDDDLTSEPLVERSGEELHFSLCGCDRFDVVNRFGDSTPNTFDSGDTWTLHGRFLHRSHAFEPFSFAFGGSRPGEYDPEIEVRFHHDQVVDQTEIALVYGLDQIGAAQLAGEAEQPIDLNVSNHTSISEVLFDIVFAAKNTPDPGEGTAFDLLREWEDVEWEDLVDFVDPTEWAVNALFGTAYMERQDEAAYVWTDIGFEHSTGDLNGDQAIDSDDLDVLKSVIQTTDGTGFDGDGILNGQVRLADFGIGFSLFDVLYDGAINALDAEPIQQMRRGDLNLDGLVDAMDMQLLIQMLGTSRGDPEFNAAADFNHDDQIDSRDHRLLRRAIRLRSIRSNG